MNSMVVMPSYGYLDNSMVTMIMVTMTMVTMTMVAMMTLDLA